MNNIKFEDLNLSSEILKAIEEKGYVTTTPIQEKTIPVILEGYDIIGESHTGSGKTAAFAIPLIEKIDAKNHAPQALILAPTRELAIQITKEIDELTKYSKGIKSLAVYGGQPIERQLRGLKSGVQIIVGTPGRVMDHLKRKTIKTLDINTIVLDEADEMLNMGFEEDIVTILKRIPFEHQTVLFSATIPPRILDITKKYQQSPVHIKIKRQSLTVPNITQTYIEVKEHNKLEVLTRLIDIYNPNLSIIFCNTKRKVDELVEQLGGKGYLVDGIHGDMKQGQRDNVMRRFRNRNINILIATDVAARGIDVDDIEIVFNYDVPLDDEYYIHRIGRTSRIGKEGKSITFAGGKQIHRIRAIEKYIKAKINRQDVPSIRDVRTSKENITIKTITDVIESQDYAASAEHFFDRLQADGHSTLDAAKALYTLFVDNKRTADVNEQDDVSTDNRSKVTLFFNVGKKDKLKNKDFVKWLTAKTNIMQNEIGNIDVHENFTFIEVPSEFEDEIIKRVSGSSVRGRKVSVESKQGNRKSNKRRIRR